MLDAFQSSKTCVEQLFDATLLQTGLDNDMKSHVPTAVDMRTFMLTAILSNSSIHHQ